MASNFFFRFLLLINFYPPGLGLALAEVLINCFILFADRIYWLGYYLYLILLWVNWLLLASLGLLQALLRWVMADCIGRLLSRLISPYMRLCVVFNR